MAFWVPHIFLNISTETVNKNKSWRTQQRDFSDSGKNFAECINVDQISAVSYAGLLLTSVGGGLSTRQSMAVTPTHRAIELLLSLS